MNKIKEAFSEIKAEDELVQKTLAAVTKKAAQKKPRSLGRALGFVAGAACALVFFVAFGVLSATPTASVSMDVNPSIELSLNRFDKVLLAIPKNEDAEQVLSGLALTNMPYIEALQTIVATQQALGYLADGSDVVFAIQSDNTTQQEKLMLESKSYVSSISGQQRIACYAANSQEWAEAHQHGISPGKYMAIQELQQYDSAVTVDEYAHHSMREIRQEIQHHQTDEPLQNSDDAHPGSGSSNGHGQTTEQTNEHTPQGDNNQNHGGNGNPNDSQENEDDGGSSRGHHGNAPH